MTAAAVALIVTLVTVPAVRLIMVRGGVVDHPGLRSSHRSVTPRGGGAACALGVLAGLTVAGARGDEVPWSLIACALALCALGYADDRFTLPAPSRLVVHVVVGALVGLAAGTAVGTVAGLVVGCLAGALVVPAVVNGVNFMDGINGITSLTMTVWGVTALLLGAHQHVPTLTVVGAVTAGSALGFLPWNAPRAWMFLGDMGSYLFGGLVCVGLALGWSHGARLEVLLAPLALYAADTGSTLLRRAARGASVTSPHREHVYQQLVNEAGLPHLLVSVLVALLAIALTLVWALTPARMALGVTLVVCAGYLVAPILEQRARAALPHLGSASR